MEIKLSFVRIVNTASVKSRKSLVKKDNKNA